MSAATVGLVGLGYWGPNLARNFDNLADLAWLCDLDEEQRVDVRARATRAPASPPTSTRCSPIPSSKRS